MFSFVQGSRDPYYPKIQFPSDSNCYDCLNNAEKVSSYLSHFYSDSSVSEDEIVIRLQTYVQSKQIQLRFLSKSNGWTFETVEKVVFWQKLPI